jgi:hypothetical protein
VGWRTKHYSMFSPFMGQCSRSPHPAGSIPDSAMRDERSACPRDPTEPRCHPGGGTGPLPCYFKWEVYNNGWERKQTGQEQRGNGPAGGAAWVLPTHQEFGFHLVTGGTSASISSAFILLQLTLVCLSDLVHCCFVSDKGLAEVFLEEKGWGNGGLYYGIFLVWNPGMGTSCLLGGCD